MDEERLYNVLLFDVLVLVLLMSILVFINISQNYKINKDIEEIKTALTIENS